MVGWNLWQTPNTASKASPTFFFTTINIFFMATVCYYQIKKFTWSQQSCTTLSIFNCWSYTSVTATSGTKIHFGWTWQFWCAKAVSRCWCNRGQNPVVGWIIFFVFFVFTVGFFCLFFSPMIKNLDFECLAWIVSVCFFILVFAVADPVQITSIWSYHILMYPTNSSYHQK